MNILGIADSQDAGAALFVDGELQAAVNEERLNRHKLWGGFPRLSILQVLDTVGVAPSDIDLVVVGSRITPNILARMFRDIHQPLRRNSGQFGYLLNAFITYQVAARGLGLPLQMETLAAGAILRRELAKLGIRSRVVMTDHHRAHAYAAWATAPFDTGLVITVDGLGDGLGLSVGVGDAQKGLRVLHRESGFSALTLYYSRLTEFLGFRPIRDEGKVNALAGYTDKTPAIHVAQRILRHENGRFNIQNHLLPASMERPPYSELKGLSPQEVAASFQAHLEHEFTDFVQYWLRRTDMRNVAVAGGFFANVKLNQRIAQMPRVQKLWVFPHMGDGGLAVGGVYAFLHARPRVLQHVYLGPGYGETQMRAALEASGLHYKRYKAIHKRIAQALARGKTVARFNGAMEYGPRALGNRSILVRADDPDTRLWLNERLGRTVFMPFAPAVLDERFDECFVGGHKVADASRFMTVSLDCTPYYADTMPGAMHVDRTARPQRVTRDGNPDFYAILKAYEGLTGRPGVVNTSFNMHEEPITATPEDAIRAFSRAGLDYLAMGPFLAWQTQGTRK